MARLLLVATALATALTGAACSGGDSDSAAAGADRLTSYALDADGITIAVPAGWRAVTNGRPLSAEDLEAVRTFEPELLPVIEEAAKPGSTVVLFAFGPEDRPADYASTLLVLAYPLPDDVPPEQFRSSREVNVRDLYHATPEADDADLPAGPARRLRFDHEVSHLTRTISQVEYVLAGERTAYILSYTALPDEIETLEPLFAASAQSFRTTR